METRRSICTHVNCVNFEKIKKFKKNVKKKDLGNLHEILTEFLYENKFMKKNETIEIKNEFDLNGIKHVEIYKKIEELKKPTLELFNDTRVEDEKMSIFDILKSTLFNEYRDFNENSVTNKDRKDEEKSSKNNESETRVKKINCKNSETYTEENELLKERINKQKCKLFLDIENSGDFPKIGISYSGGGIFSLLQSIGITKGLQECGIFDSIMYATGVSGGSWFISSLLSFDGDLEKVEKKIKEYLISENLSKNVDFFKLFFSDIKETMEAFTNILKEILNDSEKKISDCRNVQMYPYPILSVGRFVSSNKMELIEITPISSIFTDMNIKVPTEYFGCNFVNGKINEFYNEMPLSQLISITGSAFELNLGFLCKINENVKFLVDYFHLDKNIKLKNRILLHNPAYLFDDVDKPLKTENIPLISLNNKIIKTYEEIEDPKSESLIELGDFGINSSRNILSLIHRGCKIIIATVPFKLFPIYTSDERSLYEKCLPSSFIKGEFCANCEVNIYHEEKKILLIYFAYIKSDKFDPDKHEWLNLLKFKYKEEEIHEIIETSKKSVECVSEFLKTQIKSFFKNDKLDIENNCLCK